MIGNKCIPLEGDVLDTPVYSNNYLRAIINGKPFEASIVGGRYDGNPEKWIRRSWGRAPLTEGDTTHALIFISCWPEMQNGEEYDLSEANIPVSIDFTNLFPAEDGDEFEYLVKVTNGSLKLTHDFDKFHVKGNFAFSVEIEQPDESIIVFKVENGELDIGPS
uniref:hypothetical protein n=1 Tax=Serratia quinivorans TaxID=137545 RepID=UPI0035C77E3F